MKVIHMYMLRNYISLGWIDRSGIEMYL